MNNINNNSYKNAFNEIIKNLKCHLFLFSCNSCHHYLFPSSTITSLYLLKDKHYCYVIENSSEKYFTISDTPKIEDDFLIQKDTYYSEVNCKYCNELIGNKIIMSNYEKNFLCDSIIIRNDKVIQYKVDNYHLVQYKFKFSFEKVLKSKEYQMISELNEKMNTNFLSLENKMKGVSEGNDLIAKIPNISNEIEKLKKIFEYLQYKTKINKQEKDANS